MSQRRNTNIVSFVLLLLLLVVIPPEVRGKNAETCEASTSILNSAFVFIKPHANTRATQELVEDKLAKAGIKITAELDISGEEIDRKGYIDQHYYSIASKATILPANQIPVPMQKFTEEFGESWTQVLKEKRACNAMEACERFQCSPEELNEAWQKTKAVKFGGGFYCGKISMNGKPELYVFNAFFMAMRSKFIGNNSIHCYVVEWEPSSLSWSNFRNKILGPTDPKEAPLGSIRRAILEKYQQLGLSSLPNKSDNGVHASASPFEGLAEKANWLGKAIHDDTFGKALLDVGLSRSKISSWFKDPQIMITELEKGSLFDTLEDMDANDCILKLSELNKLN